MTTRQRRSVPALQFDWALPLFDPLERLLGVERDLYATVEGADPKAGQSLLDIGCGTGTLAIHAKRMEPALRVVGLDPDPHALARCERKATRAGVSVEWQRGFADELPYPDTSFDHVTSTFMFHHLGEEERVGTLREVRRVLKPFGLFHLTDFGEREAGSLRQRVFPQGDLATATDDGFLSVLRAAGFDQARILQQRSVRFVGRVVHYRAQVTLCVDGSAPPLG